MRLPGCAAFVTGAAQGLGKAFSESLLQRGARVCLSDVQVNKGLDVEKEFKSKYGKDNVMFLECDVRSEASFSGAFHKAKTAFGSINLLVNNAGIANEGKYLDVININLTGTVIGTGLAIEHMRKDKGGKGGTVINVASTAGLVPVYFCPVYVASKHGVVGFTKAWAGNPHNREMGMQFACLCPAFTDTAIIKPIEGGILYLDAAAKFMKEIGIQDVENVNKGFVRIVEKEDCNGVTMTVTAKHGIQVMKNAKTPTSQL